MTERIVYAEQKPELKPNEVVLDVMRVQPPMVVTVEEKAWLEAEITRILKELNERRPVPQRHSEADLCERLCDPSLALQDEDVVTSLCHEAATEIERLRAALQAIVDDEGPDIARRALSLPEVA